MKDDEGPRRRQAGTVGCKVATAAILRADPAELSGVGQSPLAVHLRVCKACRERAGRILKAQAALDRALQDLSSAVSLTDFLATHSPGTSDSPPVQVKIGRETSGRGRIGRWIAASAVPLAAALVLAVVLRDARAPQEAMPGPWEAAERETPATLAVEPDDARDFLVLETRNPNVAVIWFF